MRGPGGGGGSVKSSGERDCTIGAASARRAFSPWVRGPGGGAMASSALSIRLIKSFRGEDIVRILFIRKVLLIEGYFFKQVGGV